MTAGGGLCLVAVVVLILELIPWGREFMPRCSRSQVYPETATIAALPAEDQRVLTVTPRTAWGFGDVPPAVLPPNSATVYGYDSVGGYDSLFPRNYRDFVFAVEGAEPAPAANANMLLPSRRPGWALAGVGKTVLGAGVVIESPGCPRAFVAVDADPWRQSAESVVVWAEERLDTIIEQARPGGGQRDLCAPVAAYTRPGPMNIDVTIGDSWRTADAPDAIVVVTETFYPGWRAYVDDTQRAIETIAGTFCGVPLRAGDEEVRLVFLPESLQVGVFVTLLGMALLVGTGVFRIGAKE